jgi:23S rRNA (cytidine1920-2'-O)/16S rRNA (cytidine1409-2'-O)-methyltransferase
VVLEETDIRSLAPRRLAPPPTLVVVDVSFISLKPVLPPALQLAQAQAWLVALIKPQFEAGRAEVNRQKGVIRDPQIHAAVTEDVAGAVAAIGWRVLGLVPSPILGREGNREFLLGAVHD